MCQEIKDKCSEDAINLLGLNSSNSDFKYSGLSVAFSFSSLEVEYRVVEVLLPHGSQGSNSGYQA